jgi:ATP-dependent DNA ligase
MARDRLRSYVGPAITIKPSELARYEHGIHAGKWAVEAKEDGHWCLAKFDYNGTLVSLESRTGASFDKADIAGLIGQSSHLFNTELVGELECGTQAANKRYAELKHRRIHFFDMQKLLNKDVTSISYEQRRKLLEIAFKAGSHPNFPNKKFLLIEQRTSGFADFFDKITNREEPWRGEGVVIKRLDSKYKSYNSDGKVDFWVRAKTNNTVDYFVMGLGKTPSGDDNLDCGLWNKTKIEHVLYVPFPKGYKASQLIGKVIECRGWEIMDSGALRSAQFVRIRNDKTESMCKL